MKSAHPTLCEIACRPADFVNLPRAVKLCAEQIGLSLDLVTTEQRPQDVPTITFHLGPDETAPGHQLLCFVCRLACLCPQARVGTIVHATSAFRRERLHRSA